MLSGVVEFLVQGLCVLMKTLMLLFFLADSVRLFFWQCDGFFPRVAVVVITCVEGFAKA